MQLRDFYAPPPLIPPPCRFFDPPLLRVPRPGEVVFWPQTYKNFGRGDPQWAQARAQYLFARGRGRFDSRVCALRVESPAAGRCLGAGVEILPGVWPVFFLALRPPGGYVARWMVAPYFLCGWAGVCCLCAWACIAVACWRVRVCV